MSNKYGQKLLDSAKTSTTEATKTGSKRAEGTGDLIGNKIADKLTSVSTKSTKELQKNKTEVGRPNLRDIPEKDRYLQKKGNKLFMN